MAPTTAQIRAQLEAVLKRDPLMRAIAILSPAREEWPERLDLAGRPFRLTWCESSLAARQALVERAEDEGVVLLTALSEQALGDDVLARLAKPRLLRVESWEMVRDAFQARNIDPRIAGKPWIAELLLERANGRSYPPVAGALLDADTAWQHVLDRALGMTVARPDAEALLEWTITDGGLARFLELRSEARSEIVAWLGDVTGPVGALIMACVQTGMGADALPLGLVAEVVFGDGWSNTDLTAAAVRMEPFVGGRRIAADHGRAWSMAATRVIRRLDHIRAWRLLERADALLHQLHAADHAATSSVMISGFEARLEGFATELSAACTSPLSAAQIRGLEKGAGSVLAHDQAKQQKARAERVAMAMRLVRWLGRPEPKPATFIEAARDYAGDGAFVDWARLTLAGGDELAPLSTAYSCLVQVAGDRRERLNQVFARLLQQWNAAPSSRWPVVPVEMVLDEVVASVATVAPALLLVMDGLSLGVYRELTSDLSASGWTEMVPAHAPEAGCAVAMLPTLTEVSRTSLLCGRPTRGNSSSEKSGFSEHGKLRAASKAGQPPLLFHKAELSENGALAPAVRDAVGSPERRVVGVIYNAIDDWLDGPEQLRLRWSLDDMRLLRPVLHEARIAGRVVIITADHGHLVEAGSQIAGSGDGDRWRAPDGRLSSTEVEINKGRVLTPAGGDMAVMPWSERVRYSMRKNGYHGGVTPQEVLVPLAVLAATAEVAGWTPAAPVQPDWWEASPAPLAAPEPPPRPPATGRKRTSAQPTLFDAVQPGPVAPDDWVERLLASPVYAAQKQLAARGAPKDEDVRKVLVALSERGGKLSRIALAQRLGVPQLRLGGLIMSARRILNVDQVPVLDIDEASDTVALNRRLLDLQFELKC